MRGQCAGSGSVYGVSVRGRGRCAGSVYGVSVRGRGQCAGSVQKHSNNQNNSKF